MWWIGSSSTAVTPRSTRWAIAVVRGEAGVGAAQVLAHARQPLREPLHVELVDDGRVPGTAQELVALPVERRVDHDGLRDRRGVVRLVHDEVVAVRVAERAALDPADRPLDRLRVRVDQQLVRVEPVTLLRRPGPVDAVPVALARPDAGQVAVPVVSRHARQLVAGLDVGLVEEAQLDSLRVLGGEREVRPAAVPGGTERKRVSGPRPHRGTLPAGLAVAPRYPAASAERRPRSAHTVSRLARSSGRPNPSATWVGSPARKPRPASSAYVMGLKRASACSRVAEQRQRHVHRREEEEQEDRHLHQRAGLDGPQSRRDPGRPEEAADVDDQRRACTSPTRSTGPPPTCIPTSERDRP